MSASSEEAKQEGEAGGVLAVVRGFFSEVSAEFGRITWPRGRELVESTVVVLFFIVILSVVVLFFDKVIEWALKLVMGA